MNPQRDDEYAGLDDLLGGGSGDDGAADAATEASTVDDSDSANDPGDDGLDDPADADAWVGLPADLDAEYAEAYRRGYARALRGGDPKTDATSLREPAPQVPAGQDTRGQAARSPDPRTQAARSQDPEPTQAIELVQDAAADEQPASDAEPTRLIARPEQAAPTHEIPSPTHAEPTQRIEPSALAKLRESALAGSLAAASTVRDWAGRGSSDAGAGEEKPRERRVVAAGLGALALLVIAGAFGIGRMFADSTAGSGAGAEARVTGGATRNGEPVYRGPARNVAITDASASCQTDNSYDAAGNVVTYEPARAFDANRTTAWRCDGSGRGQRFTVSLPQGTVVARVGLVPGYAKTDPASGADRYAENNRITKVRWRFDDGSSFEQRMSGDPANRRMRTMRIPETSTGRVVLEILASQPGPRNTVAISELRIASPRG